MSKPPVDPHTDPVNNPPQDPSASDPTLIVEQRRDAPTGPKVIPADKEAQKVIDAGKSKM